MKIDLNSDMGEGFGRYTICDDEALMGVVTSANLACGFHAGDPDIMCRMVRLAKKNGVTVGAHPGLPDMKGFGRRELAFGAEEIKNQIVYQFGALRAIAAVEGVPVGHISFHAALSNMLARDPDLAELVLRAVRDVDADVVVSGQVASTVGGIARSLGLRTIGIFASDRAYDAEGRLVSRALPDSVIKDRGLVRARIRQFLETGTVTTYDGGTISLDAKSILVHSDTAGSLELARTIRKDIEDAGGVLVSRAELMA